MPTLELDTKLIKRYDISGPRYTSYPTAVQFSSDFSVNEHIQQTKQSNQSGRALSLYFHLPFCTTICYYCACNKIVTKNRNRAQPYLDRLHKEISLQSNLFDSDRIVRQLHWGGGTPTFINHQQMRELMQVTAENFNLLSDDSGEYSIEIDPREANSETIRLLRDIGFNRLSLGIQDFNPDVQKAVNRIQTYDETAEVINTAKLTGFKSVSLDLIYGLPLQNKNEFHKTLQAAIKLDPDRISIFNYAHLPDMFKTQRQINADDLPSTKMKLSILEDSINTLRNAGYVYIGMDHFAKPDDELAIAQRKENLYRNFQGYSTHADCDLIGLGVTSISKIHNSYSQNHRSMDDYVSAIDNNQLAVFRGIELNDDDMLRREIITQLICHYRLNIKKIETAYNINFKMYFSNAQKELEIMSEDGLLIYTNSEINVTAKGNLFIRNICMLFDRYLHASQARYSKAI